MLSFIFDLLVAGRVLRSIDIGVHASAEIMKINTLRMATPIEERLEQNLKVRTGIVTVSDGKSNPEQLRLKLTMELLILQKWDGSIVSTPTTSSGPPESKVCNTYYEDKHKRVNSISNQSRDAIMISCIAGANDTNTTWQKKWPGIEY